MHLPELPITRTGVILSMMTMLQQAQAGGIGQWSASIPFPLVPAAAVVVPTTGHVVAWSAYKANSFTILEKGTTQTCNFDPVSKAVTQHTVTVTRHDMFCPGLSIDFQGRPIVTGGANSTRTSFLNIKTNTWVSGPALKIPRGYQASATTSNGKTFMIGGSWSGGKSVKNGEIYDPATNRWSLLPGATVAPMLTNDRIAADRDFHAWLFAWKNGYVLQAGPSKHMNWYNTAGGGSHTPAGLRGDDNDAMNGNAVMYDAAAGKILTIGGAPWYRANFATTNAHIITLGAPGTAPTVEKINRMIYRRAHSNSVVLPTGHVFITGGQFYPVQFTDANATLTPELWDPKTQKFTPMAALRTPRAYHSIALLLPDATVLNGGGGLCPWACDVDHDDVQIFSPPYLFKADGVTKAPRPTITTLSAKVIRLGGKITVNTKSNSIVTFSIVRFGSVTHSVNTDQRRIPLVSVRTAVGVHTVQFPTDAGVAIPGYWMLFAIDALGVPSVASTVQITL